jgi:hypothetical protein
VLAASAPAAGAEPAPAARDAALAGLLNALTVPGAPARAAGLCRDAAGGEEARLSSVGGGELTVTAATTQAGRCALTVAPGGPAAGGAAPVVESDLQAGNLVAHVLGPLRGRLAGAGADAGGPAAELRFESALAALREPSLGARRFGQLVEAAGLARALGAGEMRNTLLAPSDAVRGWAGGVVGGGGGPVGRAGAAVKAGGVAGGALVRGAVKAEAARRQCPPHTHRHPPPPPPAALQALEALLPPGTVWRMLADTPEGQSLAAALVSRHWAPGVALGGRALRARAAAGLDVAAADGSLLQLELG